MTDVIADAELRAKLHGGVDPVRLTDEAGNVFGYFLPPYRYHPGDETLPSPPSADERRAILGEIKADGGATFEEVMDAVRSARRAWDAQA